MAAGSFCPATPDLAAVNSPEPLLVLAFVGEGPMATLLNRVFSPRGDHVVVATDPATVVQRVRERQPDLAFVDLSFDHQAALALVHHLRALVPDVSVYALTKPDALHLGTQALSLGSAGVILLPASGDDLVSAALEVRQRKEAQRERQALLRELDLARRAADAFARIAELATASDRNQAASRLAAIFAEITEASGVGIYLRASEHSNRLVRTSHVGTFADSPSFADEMGVMTWAREAGCEILPLTVGPLATGHVLLRGVAPFDEAGRRALELLTGQAATLLSLLTERERANRGAIQDLTTSAYTFSYFVDIAGREIDKARRYGRRFALATLALDESASPEGGAELVEHVLAAIRDTDVLARVDEREFYLLFPETNGIGAQRLRRRVLERVAECEQDHEPKSLTMGLAVFPHDGADLSRLLRVAKRRADARKRSAVHTLGLQNKALEDIIDLLLDAPESTSAEGPKRIEASLADGFAIATAAVVEGLRGGEVMVVTAEHEGLGLASAVRAAVAHDRDKVELHVKQPHLVEGDPIEVVIVVAEHGVHVLAGRSHEGRLRAVHAADPLLADLLMQRLGVNGSPA